MKKKLNVLVKILSLIPTLIIMCIIWGFSNSTADESSSLSLVVTETFVDGADKLLYDGAMTETQRYGFIERFHTPVRKMAHMSEYAVLFLSTLFSMYIIYFREHGKDNLIYAAYIFCFGFAISDEIHQLFIPGRAGSPKDVMIDMVIITLICLVYYLINRKKEYDDKIMAPNV